MKETFPKDDFGVIVENNNAKEILKYLIDKGFKEVMGEYQSIKNKGTLSIFKGKRGIYYAAPGFSSLDKRYTLPQLKKLDMNNKEIIHYKLVKPEYLEAVVTIMDLSPSMENLAKFVTPTSAHHRMLEKAGVLDLWFEPVYKSEITLPTILGYNGEERLTGIKFGCREFKPAYYQNLYTTLKQFDIISYKIEAGEVKTEEIGKIIEYINKK